MGAVSGGHLASSSRQEEADLSYCLPLTPTIGRFTSRSVKYLSLCPYFPGTQRIRERIASSAVPEAKRAHQANNIKNRMACKTSTTPSVPAPFCFS